jgi:hypothetical protein
MRSRTCTFARAHTRPNSVFENLFKFPFDPFIVLVVGL